MRESLRSIGFQPEVFKKDAQQIKAKGVDVALTKDMLSHAFLHNSDAAVLIAGDGDYARRRRDSRSYGHLRPIVEEILTMRAALYARGSRPSFGASRQSFVAMPRPIASGGALPSILEAIRGRERRREDIQERLRRTVSAGSHPKGPDELRRTIQKRIADWQGLFHRHPDQARETVLRPLLAGRRFVMTPQITAGGRFYAFEVNLSYGALITGLIGAGDSRVMTVVPPG